jgi:hypothetical protein
MLVTINGAPATDLPADWEKDIHLPADARAVTGVVLDPAAGAERFLARYRIIGACFVGLVWLVLLVLASFAKPIDREVVLPVSVVIAVAMPVLIAVAYVVRLGRLYDSLPSRAERSPPPGAKIKVDDTGLAIGDRFAAWSDLSLDRVDFEVITGRHGDRTYFVHQVDVRSKDLTYTLDGLLLEEGQAIVAETFRHKYLMSSR